VAEIEIPNPHEAKEKAEDPFTKGVALCVAIYAVILALAAAGGNNAGKDMMMEQQKSTNKWGQYQAKAIREALYLNDLEKLEIDLIKGGMTPEAAQKVQQNVERIKTKLAEYKTEKETISNEAKSHEAKRDKAHKRDPYFDFAEVALQIAVVLASVAMLSGKRWAFYASIVLAIIGAILTLNGYFLLDAGKILGESD
jgi:Domain of unknown function (DUF4337)